jgi:mRNA-degrading endonuclease RelE of RelBE toxin-antitoxin system
VPKYTHRAWKEIQSLPPSLQSKAKALAKRLDEEPALGVKLKGKLSGNRSIAIGRSHRLIYSVEDSGVLVKIVQGRKDIYR